MYEYQILVRLKKTCIKSKDHIQYGNCQVCSEKYSQRCIEASQNIKGKKNTVFIFCNDCYLQLHRFMKVLLILFRKIKKYL